jgi:hypothetical protein
MLLNTTTIVGVFVVVLCVGLIYLYSIGWFETESPAPDLPVSKTPSQTPKTPSRTPKTPSRTPKTPSPTPDIENRTRGIESRTPEIDDPTPEIDDPTPEIVSPAPAPEATSFSWTTSSWSDCTTSCGGGVQTRDVWCKSDLGQRSEPAKCWRSKPESSQSCNTHACAADQPVQPENIVLPAANIRILQGYMELARATIPGGPYTPGSPIKFENFTSPGGHVELGDASGTTLKFVKKHSFPGEHMALIYAKNTDLEFTASTGQKATTESLRASPFTYKLQLGTQGVLEEGTIFQITVAAADS